MDTIEALERLTRLRDSGALSEAEFEAQKAAVLGGGQASLAEMEEAEEAESDRQSAFGSGIFQGVGYLISGVTVLLSGEAAPGFLILAFVLAVVMAGALAGLGRYASRRLSLVASAAVLGLALIHIGISISDFLTVSDGWIGKVALLLDGAAVVLGVDGVRIARAARGTDVNGERPTPRLRRSAFEQRVLWSKGLWALITLVGFVIGIAVLEHRTRTAGPGEARAAESLGPAAVAEVPAESGAGATFEDYPAALYSGPRAEPDFSGEQSGYLEYETRVRDAARQAPDFAGRQVATQVGCGTGCRWGFLVDVQTGVLTDLPLGGEEYPYLAYEHRADSRLLRTRWEIRAVDQEEAGCMRQDFVWTGASFTSLGVVQEAGRCPAS